MSILIRGMEMPKGGYRTVEIAFDADGHPMALADGGDVFDVIPVPPHAERRGERMNGTINTGGSTCAYNPYANNCIHRLPCGLCTYMHILCPLVNKMDITWTVTTGTTEEVQDGNTLP